MKILLCGNNRSAINVLREINKRIGYEVRVVVPYLKRVHEWHDSLYNYAKKAGVKKIYDSKNINDPIFINEVKDFSPDLILSVYYDQIIRQPLLSIPTYGCVNIHPSLLPKYRGVAPLIWAILKGEKKTGITFHYLDEQIDTGSIIFQEEIDISLKDTGYSLHLKAAEKVKHMSNIFFDLLEQNRLSSRPQLGEATHYKKKDFQSNQIKWENSVSDIYNKIRALSRPLPGAYTYYKGNTIFIWKSKPYLHRNQNSSNMVGQIIKTENGELAVWCTSGSLLLQEIGVSGISLTGKDFFQRFDYSEGDRFETNEQNEELILRRDLQTEQKRFITFGTPIIGQEEIEEVTDTLRSGWIGMGHKTQQFENNFAEYVQSSYAISVSSCSAALHLSLWANNIGKGDEVITTPFTFAATINAILMSGAKPVFADIDQKTFNISADSIERCISTNTKAILPVHFAGLPCNLRKINSIAKKHGIKVIEDAAHATGAYHEEGPVGSGQNIVCFSFYANKNMTTGDGGMITSRDSELAERLKIMRHHGLEGHAWKRFLSKEILYSHVVLPGFKYSMNDIQASLGIHQLTKLEKWIQIRHQYASVLDKAFAPIPGVSVQLRGEVPVRHALHIYAVIIDFNYFTEKRDRFVSDMRELGIGAAIHYPAISQHPYYASKLNLSAGSFPVAEKIAQSIISIPLTPTMTQNDIQRVATTFCEVCEKYSK